MRREAFFFTIRQAASDPFLLWSTVISLVLFVGAMAFFVWNALPSIRESGLVTLHYNTYIGIDDVRPWPWATAIPAVVLFMVSFDTIVALILFREHRLASRTVLSVQVVTLVLWAIGMYFLTLINS